MQERTKTWLAFPFWGGWKCVWSGLICCWTFCGRPRKQRVFLRCGFFCAWSNCYFRRSSICIQDSRRHKASSCHASSCAFAKKKTAQMPTNKTCCTSMSDYSYLPFKRLFASMSTLMLVQRLFAFELLITIVELAHKFVFIWPILVIWRPQTLLW
jgi:hypothetical protein